jgi:hypothetical protein
MSFYKFSKKIQIFTQNSLVLVYGFMENRQFASKTDQNSVFVGRVPHIPYQLYFMVMYMSFYGFLKNSKFPSKYISVSLRFYRKSAVCGKN